MRPSRSRSCTSVVSPQHVYPVLCFVTPQPLTGHAREVMVCSTANVLTMLNTRPRALSEDTLRRLCVDLESSFRPATERLIVLVVPSSARTRQRVHCPDGRSAPVPRVRRRRGRPLAKLTGFVATVSVMMAMLTTDLPDHIAQLLVTVSRLARRRRALHPVRTGRTSRASRRRARPRDSSENVRTDADPRRAAGVVSIRACSYVARATRPPNCGVRRRRASPCRGPAAAGR